MPSNTALPPAYAGPKAQEALYRAALGTVRADHYLPTFARFDERGASGLAWNTAAAVGNLGWLVYRQIWGAAGKLVAALAVWALMAAGLAFWADALPVGVRVGLALALLLLLLLATGLYGTALLHAQIRQRMIAAVKQATTIEEACSLLQWQCDLHRRQGALLGRAGLLLLAALLAGWVWLSSPKTPAPPTPLSEPTPVTGLALAAASPVSASVPVEPPPVVTTVTPPTVVEPPPIPVVAAPPVEAQKRPAPQTVRLTEATKPPAAADAVVRVKGHGVSVGLFTVPENAERTRAKLADAGLPVLSDPIESARGSLTRVRVGPFERRDQAQAAAQRVRALGLDARVYAP